VSDPIRLGTRASPLALAQARLVAAALEAVEPGVRLEIVEIRTTGDRRLDARLSGAGSGSLPRGLFTKELEEALLDGRADLAVHSLKDLPTDLGAGLVFAAALERAPSGDWLLSREGIRFEDLPAGARIATSSERRRRMLLWRRPDLEVVEVRGNLGTRIRKLATEPEWSGMVLAQAGLVRLGWVRAPGRVAAEGFELHAEDLGGWMVPAAGQGAIGIECRAGDTRIHKLLGRAGHRETFACVTAERALLHRVGGGCHQPVGARARVRDGGLELEAVVFPEGDGEPLCGVRVGDPADPEGLAEALWEQLHEKN